MACCCSSASRVSLKRRTFSIAITAWSANVRSSSICLSLKRCAALRTTKITPIGWPSLSIGTASTARYPARLKVRLVSGKRGSEGTSSTWITARSRIALPEARPYCGGAG